MRRTITNQTKRLLLRGVCLALLLASVLIVWRAFCTPELAKPAWGANEPSAIPRTITNARFTRPLDEFAPLTSRQLGAPLYDPPPKTKPAAEKVRAPKPKIVSKPPKITTRKKSNRRRNAGLRVIGTMLELDGSVAIIVDSEGGIQVRGEGESIDTAAGVGQVESVERNEVVVALDDDTLTLKMP